MYLNQHIIITDKIEVINTNLFTNVKNIVKICYRVTMKKKTKMKNMGQKEKKFSKIILLLNVSHTKLSWIESRSHAVHKYKINNLYVQEKYFGWSSSVMSSVLNNLVMLAKYHAIFLVVVLLQSHVLNLLSSGYWATVRLV